MTIPLYKLRQIAKERVFEVICQLSDEEVFGSADCGTKEDMHRVVEEMLLRITQ